MSQASQIFGNRRVPVATEIALPEEVAPRRLAPSMARSAIIVSAAFILSRLLGLAREVILARAFATGPAMDAYVSAFRIPDLLFLTVMSGAFGAAFIPVFGEFITKGDEARAWRLASAMLTWTGITVVGLSIIMFIFARPLMFLVSPGFNKETADIAVNLMRILLLSPVFLGLGIAAKGILEAQQQFTLPAIAPLIYNIAIIIGALFFVKDYGIYAVGWAVIFGGLGHFLVQLPGLNRVGFKFKPTISRQVDGLREVLKLLGPRVIGLAAFQVNFIAVTAFASVSSTSHVSAINYSWQLLMLPHGVLALSISTVAFPALAALHSKGDQSGFRDLLDRTMRPLLFLTIPASVGLFLLREPIVQALYERGNFTQASTALVTAPLAWFAVGMVGYGVTEILTRVFFATRDTMTPVVTGLLTIVLNIILCAILVGSMSQSGLALALSATTGAEAVILTLFLRHRIGQVVAPDFWGWLVRVLAATACMGAVVVLTVNMLKEAMRSNTGSRIAEYGIFLYAMGMYIFAFVVFALIFRIPELQAVVGKVASRLPRSARLVLAKMGMI
ncbi:MAG: murein biosynthesis integral membrane protein MurJ [Thermomicrobiales bacterium]